jgi:hypothetical protein
MSSTTTRGEAAGRAFSGGSILRADPHRRQNNGCPSHASVPFPVELARVWLRNLPQHCLDSGWVMLTAENDFGELEDYFVLCRRCKEEAA